MPKFKYKLTGRNIQSETDDVEDVLETARVWLLHGDDVTITVKKEESNDQSTDAL